MAPTPQVNIRAPLEAHESIRRLGELLRRRPDMAAAVELAVTDLERLELDSGAAGAGGGWRVVEELEAAVGDITRRLEALESGRRAATSAPAAPLPSAKLQRIRRRNGLPSK